MGLRCHAWATGVAGDESPCLLLMLLTPLCIPVCFCGFSCVTAEKSSEGRVGEGSRRVMNEWLELSLRG